MQMGEKMSRMKIFETACGSGASIGVTSNYDIVVSGVGWPVDFDLYITDPSVEDLRNLADMFNKAAKEMSRREKEEEKKDKRHKKAEKK